MAFVRSIIRSLASWFAAGWFVIFKRRLVAAQPLTDPGERHDYAGIPVVHLRGSAYQRGYQHGVLCRRELRQLETIAWQYAPQTATERLGLPAWLSRIIIKPLLRYLAATYLPRVSTDAKAEMQGLADGSGLPVADVVVNTLVWEVLAVFTAPKREHCSEVAISGAHTATGQSLLGYNYDVVVAGDWLSLCRAKYHR